MKSIQFNKKQYMGIITLIILIFIIIYNLWATNITDTTAIVTIEEVNDKIILATFGDSVTREIRGPRDSLKLLKEGKEYTISFENNKLIGRSYIKSFKELNYK